MNVEIEHKYLVVDASYKDLALSKHYIKQGYLSRTPERTIRVRIYDDLGFVTIKSKNVGDTRREFEYEIPKSDAEQLIAMCEKPVIEKNRYLVSYVDHTWEVDEFLGDLSGITIAEIELKNSTENYAKPSFVGENVTGKLEYYNSNIHKLAKKES